MHAAWMSKLGPSHSAARGVTSPRGATGTLTASASLAQATRNAPPICARLGARRRGTLALIVLAAVVLLNFATMTRPPAAEAAFCTTCSGGGDSASLPQLAEYGVTWSDFSGPCYLVSLDQQLCPAGGLPGNDDIYLQTQAGAPYGIAPTQVSVVLQTPPGITWWKEIKAFNAQGNAIGWVNTQGAAHGPTSMTIDTRTAAALVFSKAGFLGIHTGMYDLRNLSANAGKRLVFTWDRDT